MWRDVAASSLRVVSELSVGLSTKQEVGMAIQAHGEHLFTNASIAITDWPSTQVMFPPGYMPPVVPEHGMGLHQVRDTMPAHQDSTLHHWQVFRVSIYCRQAQAQIEADKHKVRP
jgi:hypothetical protein